MEKQWEESISAMTKRDQTLQAVQNIKDDVQNQLTEHQINLRTIKAHRDEAESRLKDKENGNKPCFISVIWAEFASIECQDMSGSMTILKCRLSDAEKELSHLKNELSQASVTQSAYRQDLETLKKNKEVSTI